MKKINNIGLGTAAIGRPLYINLKQEVNPAPFILSKFKEKSVKVLDDAYNQGVRHFDTAAGYGIAEELLINWLPTKNDSSIRVSSKWGYTYVANFDANAKQHEVKEHSLENLNKQWEYSKLLLPYLKVYQIHSATFDTGVLENREVLNRLHELKNKYNIIIGLSTTGANQIEVLEKGLSIQIENQPLFQSFQCTYNILDQSISNYREEFRKRSGPFIIKEALANGRLIPNQHYSNYNMLYNFMNSLAIKYDVDADAIALRFCLEVFPKAIVLSGADNSIHLTANLKAAQFSLTNSEIEQLKSFEISPNNYWNERKQLKWN